MNDLIRRYRDTQRRLRAQFQPFTEEFCPVCPHPCCRKPARIRELDVMLAQAHGFTPPAGADPVADTLYTAVQYLAGEEPDFFAQEIPCDFLGDHGCTFPTDLRPHGCTRFICDIMEREMPPATLREIRRLIRKLDTQYAQIRATVTPRRKKWGAPLPMAEPD